MIYPLNGIDPCRICTQIVDAFRLPIQTKYRAGVKYLDKIQNNKSIKQYQIKIMRCNLSINVSQPSSKPNDDPRTNAQLADSNSGNTRVLKRKTKQEYVNLGIHSQTVSFVYQSGNKSAGVSASKGDHNVNGNCGKQRYMTNIAEYAIQQNPEIPHPVSIAKPQSNLTKTKKPAIVKPNINPVSMQTSDRNRSRPQLQESMIKITVESDLKEIPRTNTYRFTNSEIVLSEENRDNQDDAQQDAEKGCNAAFHDNQEEGLNSHASQHKLVKQAEWDRVSYNKIGRQV